MELGLSSIEPNADHAEALDSTNAAQMFAISLRLGYCVSRVPFVCEVTGVREEPQRKLWLCEVTGVREERCAAPLPQDRHLSVAIDFRRAVHSNPYPAR